MDVEDGYFAAEDEEDDGFGWVTGGGEGDLVVAGVHFDEAVIAGKICEGELFGADDLNAGIGEGLTSGGIGDEAFEAGVVGDGIFPGAKEAAIVGESGVDGGEGGKEEPELFYVFVEQFDGGVDVLIGDGADAFGEARLADAVVVGGGAGDEVGEHLLSYLIGEEIWIGEKGLDVFGEVEGEGEDGGIFEAYDGSFGVVDLGGKICVGVFEGVGGCGFANVAAGLGDGVF